MGTCNIRFYLRNNTYYDYHRKTCANVLLIIKRYFYQFSIITKFVESDVNPGYVLLMTFA